MGLDLKVLRQMAVEGILRRTLKLLRRFRRKTRLGRVPWIDAPSGEIALDETLDRAMYPHDLQPSDIIVETRIEKPLDLVMLIDTSLSMTGRKLAMAAVGAAVLSFRLRAESFAVVAFGSTTKTLKSMRQHCTPQQTIEKILDAPLLGYTNIETALRAGHRQLLKGRSPLKIGVLLTDGQFTEGADPEPAASRFRRLEVMMTIDHNSDRDCCARMARAGKGHVTEVRRYKHLPEKLLGVIRSLQQ